MVTLYSSVGLCLPSRTLGSMDSFFKLTSLVSAPLSAWPVLQEKSRHVVDLVKAHPWTYLGVAAGTALVWSYGRAPRNLPPGPSGYPLIGTTTCLTANLPACLLEWRKQYGDVISFYKHDQLYVILNSESSIKEAYIKQDDAFSTMNVHLFNSLGIDDEIFASPFNDTWKTNKRFAVSSLKNSGFGTTKSEGKIHELLTNTMENIQQAGNSTVDIFKKLRLASAGTMSMIVLGGSGSLDDPDTIELVRLIDEWYGTFNEAFIAASLFSPANMLIPQSLFSYFYAKVFGNFKKVHNELIDFLSTKVKTAASNVPCGDTACVVDTYLKDRGASPEAIQTFVKTVLVFFPDAIDTACIITSWCLLYTTFYPQVQKRLYEEIKSTIGTTHLPTFTDRIKMPFTQAVMSETLRLTHITPLSTVRVLKSPAKVNGYTLPKGTNVSANYYAIHYDPEIFPEPFEFKPSRFIDADGNFNSALAARLVPFSIGNRKCIGQSYFKVYIFLVLIRLLQRFELCLDPAAPTPSLEPDSNFFYPKPQPFKVCFKTRLN